MNRTFFGLALLALAACSQGPSPQVQARMDSLTAAAAEREQLVQEVSMHARALSEISAELAKVQVPRRTLRVSAESPLGAARDTAVQKIRYLARRVNETEAGLRESRERVGALTTLSDSLKTTLDQTIANYEQIVQSHVTTIDSLSRYAAQLEVERAALSDSLGSVTERVNTVHYVIGTAAELRELGLVEKEGQSRFLFVLWKQGGTLVPSRDLDPQHFTAINKRDMVEIPLPDPTAEYTIASRHDLQYLETPADDDGVIRNASSLRIAYPEQFWENSQFLIVVRRGGNGSIAPTGVGMSQ